MRGKQTFDSFDVLYIELTNSCNLNCFHCGNEAGEKKHLDLGLIEKVLKEFNAGAGKKLVLTGGEPLLHPQIKDILKLASSHAYHTKISTNAYLLNDPRFNFVLDYDLGFRVSLDGTKEAHNTIRRNPFSYDMLVSAMKKMSEKDRQIVIRTTVMQQNKDSIVDMLYELDRLSKSEGLKIYSNNIWPVRNIGKSSADLMLTPLEYEKFLRDLNARTRELKPSFRIIVGPTFGLETEFKGGPIQDNEIYKCDILNTSLQIAFNGDIYPCSFVHHTLGNISTTSLKDLFRSKEAVEFRKTFLAKERRDCDGCTAYDSCKGGCIAETYTKLFDGSKQKVRDVYCNKQRSQPLEIKCGGDCGCD